MPHVRTITPRTLLAALFLAALILALPPAPEALAGQQALFNKAIEGFKYVQAKESRAKRRDLWLQVHDRFQGVLKAGPDTGYAPKALYYMGRCCEELAARSGLRSDALRAVDYFQRAVTRFAPGHSWIDDCLLRKAEVSYARLGDARGAAEDLRTILRLYAGGDQAGAAGKFLERIEARAAAPAPRPAPAPAPKAESPGYGALVRRFRALRADPKATREAFQRIARSFEDLSKTSDSVVHAARSAYFAGFAWDELGRRSGRDEDSLAAVAQYQRAVDMFAESDSWRDDALLRKGRVEYERLNDEDQAYADLLLVVRDYPGGDQAAEAKALLRAMDEARAGEMPDAGAAAEPAPAAPEPRAAATFGKTEGAATLTAIRHFSGDDFTRVVLDLDNAAVFKEQSLPADPATGKPPRMFVDIERTRLDPSVKGRTDLGGGFLRSVRAAQNKPGTVRVVLDFKDRQEYHILTLENPYRIVIDVFAEETVDKAAEARVAAPAAPAAPQAPPRTPGKKERDTAADVLAQLGMTIQTVMIDAGHGGRDPGAVQYVSYRDDKGKLRKKLRTKEKDVTLRLAKILGDALRAKGFNVLYTRSGDAKVALEDRVLKANMQKADLFISLHCNANRSSKVRGFETYYLGKAKSDIVLRLAAKENNVDPVKISDTQKIVLDLVHSFKIEESKGLARYVQDSCVSRLKNGYKDINDHGARSAPFFVLIGAKMPAVLVEVGYISNPTEAKLLRSDAYLKAVAGGIVTGIEAYRKELRTAGL